MTGFSFWNEPQLDWLFAHGRTLESLKTSAAEIALFVHPPPSEQDQDWKRDIHFTHAKPSWEVKQPFWSDVFHRIADMPKLKMFETHMLPSELSQELQGSLPTFSRHRYKFWFASSYSLQRYIAKTPLKTEAEELG